MQNILVKTAGFETQADTYFFCNRLRKDIKGDKRTGYSPRLDRAKIYG